MCSSNAKKPWVISQQIDFLCRDGMVGKEGKGGHSKPPVATSIGHDY